MRLVRVAAPALCALVALAAVVGAWLEPRPDLERADAREFAQGALTAAGFERVRVSNQVGAEVDTEGTEAVQVWVTTSRVQGGEVELWVDRSVAQAVRVSSEPSDLVSDAAFERLDDFDDDPLLDERIRRNLAVTVAGLLGAAVSFVIAGSLGRTT
jgi:hypothetical protein